MSQQTATRPPNPFDLGRRQLQYLIAVGSILAVGVLAVIVLAHKPPEPPAVPTADEEQLNQTIARLNQTDPNWKFADLEAHREPPPKDDKNPAPQVLLASFKLEQVGARLTINTETARKGLRDGTITDRKHAGLEPAADALETARRLRNYGPGQYAVMWNTQNPLMTPLPHKAAAIAVVDVLTLDAEMLAHERKIDEALESVQAALVATRAISDEPMMATQIQRPGFHQLCTRALEESLRLGSAQSEKLDEMQRALRDEAEQPWLKYGARGERAGLHELMTALEDGIVTRADRYLLDTRADGVALILSSWKPRPLARIHNLILDYSTQFIQLIDLPPKQQQPRLKELGEMLKDAPREVPSLLSAFAVKDLIELSHNGEAALHCAEVGMALERYRMTHDNKWPETLDELVAKNVLKKVPIDPFDGEQPLRYERTKEGVVVYSVGPEGKAGPRRFERRDDADTSFRLWNVEARRH